jgi:hypothetical protein
MSVLLLNYFKNELPMQHNYTFDDVILYIYNELDPEESYKVQQELQNNPELQNEYNQTVKMLGMMDKLIEYPSPTTIDLILEYSYSNVTERSQK